jgi:general secretion pathway protein L
MVQALSDFWIWWAGTLGLLARRVVPGLAMRRDGFTLTLSRVNAVISRAGGAVQNGDEGFQIEELPERLAALSSNGRTWTQSGVIRLGKDRHVLRPLSRLSLPSSCLAAAAALDLSVSTPFKADQVWILPVSGAVQAASCAIVKRPILDAAIMAFRSNGIRVSGIEFETPNGVFNLAPGARHLLLQNGDVWTVRLFKASVVAIALALFATAAHVWMRNEVALAVVSKRVEALTAEAKIVRKLLDQRIKSLAELTALRNKIEDAEPVAGIWEELARVLPDSAYLTDLSVEGSEVSISGYALQAAALLVALEQSPLFSKANFTGPVVKTPGLEGEHFEISLAAGG